MRKTPSISKAEWAIMQSLWAQSPLTAEQIIDTLPDESGRSPRTTKTLINRLLRKGAIGYRKDGRRYSYYPKVEQETCVHAESRSFLDRVFGGAVMPMLVMFAEEGRLTERQLDELKAILDRCERRKR